MPERSSQAHALGDDFLPDLKLAMPLHRAHTYPSELDVKACRALSRPQHMHGRRQQCDLRREDICLGRVKETKYPHISSQRRETRHSTNRSVFATDRPHVHSKSMSNGRPPHYFAAPHDTFFGARDNTIKSSRAEKASEDHDTQFRKQALHAPALQRWHSQSARQEPYSMIADPSSPSAVSVQRHRL